MVGRGLSCFWVHNSGKSHLFCFWEKIDGCYDDLCWQVLLLFKDFTGKLYPFDAPRVVTISAVITPLSWSRADWWHLNFLTNFWIWCTHMCASGCSSHALAHRSFLLLICLVSLFCFDSRWVLLVHFYLLSTLSLLCWSTFLFWCSAVSRTLSLGHFSFALCGCCPFFVLICFVTKCCLYHV